MESKDEDGAAAKAAPAVPRGRWCPEENAGFLSRLLFIFVGGLIKLGYRWVGHDVADPDSPLITITRAALLRHCC